MDETVELIMFLLFFDNFTKYSLNFQNLTREIDYKSYL